MPPLAAYTSFKCSFAAKSLSAVADCRREQTSPSFVPPGSQDWYTYAEGDGLDVKGLRELSFLVTKFHLQFAEGATPEESPWVESVYGTTDPNTEFLVLHALEQAKKSAEFVSLRKL